MKKIVIGNWKMHGSLALAQDLALAASEAAKTAKAQVVLCPPAILIPAVGGYIRDSQVALGAQDCHGELQGAYTGDISAPMLKEAGVTHVLVGHSERRALHGETSALVRQKAMRVLENGLIPVICVGETLTERERGQANEVVSRQLKESIPDNNQHVIIAYEPVWAIGTGKTATMDDICQMHRYILGQVQQRPVLYGGSVKADNAQSIMAMDEVAGVLVGGASLKAEEFCRIIAAAE